MGVASQTLPSLRYVAPLALGRGLLPSKCDVVSVNGGKTAVLKESCAVKDPLRRFLGRVAVQRELRAYGRLAGLTGIPALYGRVGTHGLLLQYIEGFPVDEAVVVNPREFVQRFENLLGCMHARGVSHGELRRAHVLVDGSQQPWLVDFATATVTDTTRPSLLFRLQKRLDRYGWLLIKERMLAGGLTSAEREEQRRNRLLASIFRRKVL